MLILKCDKMIQNNLKKKRCFLSKKTKPQCEKNKFGVFRHRVFSLKKSA
jgi:hypothetical protein